MYTEIETSNFTDKNDILENLPLIPVKMSLFDRNVNIFQLINRDNAILSEIRFDTSIQQYGAYCELIHIQHEFLLPQDCFEQFFNFAENTMNSKMIIEKENNPSLKYTLFCNYSGGIKELRISKYLQNKVADSVYCL